MRYTEKQQEGRTQKDVMDDDVAAAFYARPVPMSNYYLIPQSSIEISASSESLGEKTTPEVKEVEARSEEQNRVNRKQEFGNPRHGGDFGRQYRPIRQRARPAADLFFLCPHRQSAVTQVFDQNSRETEKQRQRQRDGLRCSQTVR